METSVEELAMAERKFLHDLSNHIVVAQGMGNVALRNLQSNDGEEVDPKIIEKLEKSVGAINKMIALVKERRAVLHSLTKKVI
ncbi:hypothetical protein BIY24_00755 [Halobacteriovorax marinus]|uniref:Uncharacterized protein n=1 Tax=Halobacteriovorax marinus (strain ATCC BAA-682 / DSM 15412 / SJ) TaxID=862908 RepID=E1X2P3_HALMS|nr:hypothetical protein [Halobacteriovorax marinus]ATH06522.1 hypothetical protein BIY24_00755 [Halobacteriovorax marinus]CBW25088.1 hypothetical protein BMS_0151 [Halobacteriovorax marinus SJ]